MSIGILNGVRNWYGNRGVEDKFGGEIKNQGYLKTLEYDFNFDDYPAPSEDGAMSLVIPAYSYIVGCKIYTTVDWATGTALTVGLQQADATEIDNDGLMTAAVGVLAVLDLGKWVTGTGALIGTTIGAVDGHLVVAGTGSAMTAGSSRVIVDYLLPKAV